MNQAKKPLRVLSIGNSFSVDAHRYLWNLTRKQGEHLGLLNLVIGGCTLDMHFRNMMGDLRNYEFETYGLGTGFKISLKEALLQGEFDVITIQQGSIKSADADSYTPYAERLVEFIRSYQPKAKIYIHQTWGYEDGFERLEKLGLKDMEDMSKKIFKANEKCAKAIKADGIIRSGELMLKLAKKGIKVHRDGFHLNLGIGRYAASLLWYQTLNGEPARVDLQDFDVPVAEEEIKLVRETLKEFI